MAAPWLRLRRWLRDGVVAAVRALPPEGAEALLTGAGRVAWWLLPRRRAVAREGVARAFPTWTPHQVHRTARASFGHVGLVVADLILAERRLRGSAGARRIRHTGAWAEVAGHVAAGRGGLILSAHLGSWEAAGWGLDQRAIPRAAVVRPLDDPVLEAFVIQARGGAAVRIPKQGAVRGVLRAIRAGRWVAFLGDQNAGRHGTFLPFFRTRASTAALPALLATRFQVPVFAGFARRLSSGRHVLHLEPLPADDVLGAFHDRLEAHIRAAPTQYFWAHRRWRSRPPSA